LPFTGGEDKVANVSCANRITHCMQVHPYAVLQPYSDLKVNLPALVDSRWLVKALANGFLLRLTAEAAPLVQVTPNTGLAGKL
jgi:hypothetical protein